MSQNATLPPSRPPSRPPSSASSTASSTASSSLSLASSGSQLARVHDHTRPLPPPRLPGSGTSGIDSPRPTTFRSVTATTRGSLGGASPASPQSGAATSQPPASGAEVTLEVPRPDGERIANEYVETPFRPPRGPAEDRLKPGEQQRSCPKAERHRHRGGLLHHSPGVGRVHRDAENSTDGPITSGGSPLAGDSESEGGLRAGRAITKQPVSFTKEPAGGGTPRGDATGSLSIMCERCGRCRCESCREPPPLPSRWLCDNSCFCSAETALDYASCLCCVKGLFYHCADGGVPGGGSLESDLGGNCADEPCSCTGSRKTARWTCLGALALLLPCLLCYWPLKGCVALCEACYAKHATQGCRCSPSHSVAAAGSPGSRVAEALARDSRDPEKRLLDPIGPDL